MKDFDELKIKLKRELANWFLKQVSEPYADFYLYYLESSPDRDGDIIIMKDGPDHPEYNLASTIKINKVATVEQNFNILLPVISRLPVLSTRADPMNITAFKLRAECMLDIQRFIAKIRDLEKAYAYKDPLQTFLEFECTGKTLSDIRDILRAIPDSHVMVETVNFSRNFTGKRWYKGSK